MKALKAQDAYNSIVAYIKEKGGAYSSWYAGIASNWGERLVVDHNVAEEHHWWIAHQCHTNTAAREVEDALIKLGCDGAPGGGGEDTVYVYAYLKSAVTKP